MPQHPVAAPVADPAPSPAPPSAGTARHLPVTIRAANGDRRDDGRLTLVDRRPGERARAAARPVLLGLAVGVCMAPVPLLHLGGVLAPLAGIGFAIRTWRAATVVRDAEGTCPRCATHQHFYTGPLQARFALPLDASCPQCGAALVLDGSSPP